MSAKLAPKDALLFFARDFLAVEFPRLAGYSGDLEPIYIATTVAERTIIQSAAPGAQVYVLQEFIQSGPPISELSQPDLDVARIARDRYIPRRKKSDQRAIIEGLERLLEEIGRLYRVRLYLDEPVSGYINDRLTQWVRDAGGLPCHFHVAWLPGYVFFTADEAQREPIPLNLILNGAEKVECHIEQRKVGAGRPLYVLDYSSPLKRWRSAGTLVLKGIYRKFRRDRFYMNTDPWPHFFHAQCLLKATAGEYAALDRLLDLAKSVVVVPLHYEPEAVLGYLWDGGDQVNLASDLREVLPSDVTLVLKEHPSQPGALALEKWAEVINQPGVLAMRGGDSLEALLAQGAQLVSIGSTAVLEAVRLQAPAFVIGGPHFANAPGVTPLKQASDISTTMVKPPATEKELVNWYASFLERYCVEGRFLRGNTALNQAQEVFGALAKEAENE